MIQLYDLVALQTVKQFIEQLDQNNQQAKTEVSTHRVIDTAVQAYNQQLRQIVIKSLIEHGLGLCTVDAFITHLVPESQLQVVHVQGRPEEVYTTCPDCKLPEHIDVIVDMPELAVREVWTQSIGTDFWPPAVTQWAEAQGLPQPVRVGASKN
ncbi:hypothetical protein HYX70_03075 [Candidatus Saccharibacteria bacterium]|nr:hypothetical protein [Candidatus Saccharibacteria bacterium]